LRFSSHNAKITVVIYHQTNKKRGIIQKKLKSKKDKYVPANVIYAATNGSVGVEKARV